MVGQMETMIQRWMDEPLLIDRDGQVDCQRGARDEMWRFSLFTATITVMSLPSLGLVVLTFV